MSKGDVQPCPSEVALKLTEIADTGLADWLSFEVKTLLTQLGRHKVAAERIAAIIEQTAAQSELDVEQFDRLLNMQDREGRAILALMKRLSERSRLTADRPREAEGGDDLALGL